MADVNKSVEVSVKADLKQLLNNLKKIPGMTEAEAKKMVSALNRQLRQTEAASKKAAKASKVATNQMARGFDKAASSAKNARKQSREIGAALGSLEDVVGGINPELAGMAAEIGIAGQAFRSLSRSLATGNPIILGIVAALALAATAYTLFTAEARKAKEIQEGVNKALEEANERLKEQAGLAKGITKDYNQAQRELAVYTGQMTKHEAEILNLQDEINQKLQAELKAQNKYIAEEEALLAIVAKAKKDRDRLTEEEEKQLNIALSLNKVRSFGGTLSSNQVQVMAQMNQLGGKLNTQLDKERKFRDTMVQARQKEFETRKELIVLQATEAEIEKQAAEEKQARDKALQEHLKRMATLQGELNTLKQMGDSLDAQLFNSAVKLADGYDSINMKYQAGLSELQAQKKEIKASLELAQSTAKTEKEKAELKGLELQGEENLAKIKEREHQLKLERTEQLDERMKKFEETRAKEREKREKEEERIAKKLQEQIQSGIDTTLKGIGTFATQSAQFLNNMGEENKSVINALFRIQQAAALADIAMSTARAVARAPADYGPAAPFAVPAILAGGAAQAAVVISQPPPLHMGGIVGSAPDEQVSTLLKGEAVLDRATTARLGSDGINRLQNGGSMDPQVIVISPFKHLDRYNRSARRLSTGQPRGSGRY